MRICFTFSIEARVDGPAAGTIARVCACACAWECSGPGIMFVLLLLRLLRLPWYCSALYCAAARALLCAVVGGRGLLDGALLIRAKQLSITRATRWLQTASVS